METSNQVLHSKLRPPDSSAKLNGAALLRFIPTGRAFNFKLIVSSAPADKRVYQSILKDFQKASPDARQHFFQQVTARHTQASTTLWFKFVSDLRECCNNDKATKKMLDCFIEGNKTYLYPDLHKQWHSLFFFKNSKQGEDLQLTNNPKLDAAFMRHLTAHVSDIFAPSLSIFNGGKFLRFALHELAAIDQSTTEGQKYFTALRNHLIKRLKAASPRDIQNWIKALEGNINKTEINILQKLVKMMGHRPMPTPLNDFLSRHNDELEEEVAIAIEASEEESELDSEDSDADATDESSTSASEHASSPHKGPASPSNTHRIPPLRLSVTTATLPPPPATPRGLNAVRGPDNAAKTQMTTQIRQEQAELAQLKIAYEALRAENEGLKIGRAEERESINRQKSMLEQQSALIRERQENYAQLDFDFTAREKHLHTAFTELAKFEAAVVSNNEEATKALMTRAAELQLREAALTAREATAAPTAEQALGTENEPSLEAAPHAPAISMAEREAIQRAREEIEQREKELQPKLDLLAQRSQELETGFVDLARQKDELGKAQMDFNAEKKLLTADLLAKEVRLKNAERQQHKGETETTTTLRKELEVALTRAARAEEQHASDTTALTAAAQEAQQRTAAELHEANTKLAKRAEITPDALAKQLAELAAAQQLQRQTVTEADQKVQTAQIERDQVIKASKQDANERVQQAETATRTAQEAQQKTAEELNAVRGELVVVKQQLVDKGPVEQRLAAATTETARVQAENTELRKRAEITPADLVAVQATNGQLQQQAHEATATTRQLQADLAIARQEIITLKTELTDATAINTQLQERIRETEGRHDTNQTIITDIRTELARALSIESKNSILQSLLTSKPRNPGNTILNDLRLIMSYFAKLQGIIPEEREKLAATYNERKKELEKNISDQETELRRQSCELAKKNHLLDLNIQKLQEQLTVQTRRAEELETERQQLQSVNAEANKKIEEQAAELAKPSQKDQSALLRGEIRRLLAVNTESAKRILELSQREAEIKRVAATVQAHIEAIKRDHTALTAVGEAPALHQALHDLDRVLGYL